MFDKFFAGKRPSDLGLQGGEVRRCPVDATGCLVSEHADEASRFDDPHHVMPLVFAGRPAEAMARLAWVLAQMPDVEVITHSPPYLHAEARSRLGLVFDLEFRVNAERSQIEVRSASRLAIGDLGLNRARIERIRDAFDA